MTEQPDTGKTDPEAAVLFLYAAGAVQRVFEEALAGRMGDVSVQIYSAPDHAVPAARDLPRKAVILWALAEDPPDSEDMARLSLVRVALGRKIRLGEILDEIAGALAAPGAGTGDVSLSIAGHLFDPPRMIFGRGDKAVRLTEKERDILLFLYHCPGRAGSREDLLRHVWGHVAALETHTLETHIYRLRQKIEPDPANPKIILTTDAGYYLGTD